MPLSIPASGFRTRHHGLLPAVADAQRIARHGSETRRRSLRPAMRCTPGEFAQLELAAERAGMTVSMFMRHQCLGTAGPRSVRRPPVERAELGELLAETNRVGNNINQIARVLNSGGDAPDYITEAVADWRKLVRAFLRVLGRDEP